jgi:SAM-dependent methyltransferase
MKTASRRVDAVARGNSRSQEAWTSFWQDSSQSRCVAGAPEVWQALTQHWSTFAANLPPSARVLDLGCGAGAVARELLTARENLHVTGIDFARVPFAISPQVELLSDTPMESMPFAEASFGAVVSQFGLEYSDVAETARELARVVAPGARLSLLVHHVGSSIVATNRSRLNVLIGFLGPGMRNAFCSGDATAFNPQLAALVEKHPHDSLVVELARALPSRLSRTPRERVAIWTAIEAALAPERCLSECLNERCVAPEEIGEWLVPLQNVCTLSPVDIVCESGGAPIAWRIEGAAVGA